MYMRSAFRVSKGEGWDRRGGGSGRADGYPCLSPPNQCVGEGPPPGCRTPQPLASREGWLHIQLWGVCVSGRDDVRTIGAWWGLDMCKLLSQIAY